MNLRTDVSVREKKARKKQASIVPALGISWKYDFVCSGAYVLILLNGCVLLFHVNGGMFVLPKEETSSKERADF